MDALDTQALNDVMQFLQTEGQQVLEATLKGMSSALGGIFLTKGILPQLKKTRKAGKEPIPGLNLAIARGIGRAFSESVHDEHDSVVSDEAWGNYMNNEWWEEFNRLLLQPLTGLKAWNTYTEILTSHDNEEACELLLKFLNSEGLDPGEMSTRLSFEIDGFLYWLGPSLIREIELLATHESTTSKTFIDVFLLSGIRKFLDSQAAQKLSPGMLRRQLRTFLKTVDKTGERYLGNPFLADGADPQRLQQEARLRVAVRQDIAHALGALDVYVPLAARTSDDNAQIVPWEEIRGGQQNLVVLADPGLGKTRLLHLHARDLARIASSQIEKRIALDQLNLPILVRCDQLHAHANSSIEEACVDVLGVAKNESAAFATWLIDHLKTSENTFLLDALDEIPGSIASLPLGQKFAKWTDRSGRGRIILSSRIAGYERPHGLELTEVELQPFSDYEVHEYVDAWGLDQQNRTKILEQLKRSSFMGMARIPLLLAFICSVASQPQSLPRSRSELYGRMLDQLLGEHHRLRERSDTTSHLRLNEADRDELRRILPLLALHFSNTSNGWVDRMPAMELGQVVAGMEPKINDFIKKCVKSGILTRAGIEMLSNKPAYFFLHRTFAEYLAAVAIAARHNEWQETLHDHLWFDQDWDQVLPLIGASLHDPKPYLSQLLSASPDPLHRGLQMAARTVAELSDEQISTVQDQIAAVSSRLIKLAPLDNPEITETLHMIVDRIPDTEIRGLLRLLRHPNQRIQGITISILASLDGDDVTAALMSAFIDEHTQVRSIAAKILSEREGNDVTIALIKALTNENIYVRRSAAGILSEREGKDVTAALIKAFSDPDTGVRIGAARSLSRATFPLSEHEEKEFTTALASSLTDPEAYVYVRQAAAVALHWRRGKASTTALIAALSDKDESVRHTAAEALSRRDDEDAVIALSSALTNQDVGIRRAAADGLYWRDEEVITTALIGALTDEDAIVQYYAARALCGREGREATTALINTLPYRAVPFKKATIDDLSKREGKGVTGALITALIDPNGNLRRDAADVLRGHEGKDVTAALITALTDLEANVREAAAGALGWREGNDVTAALITALTDPDTQVRQGAVEALFRREGKDVTAALITALTDLEANVREAAAGALGWREGNDVTAALLTALMDSEESVGVAVGALLPKRPIKSTVEGLRSLIGACDDEQALLIYKRIHLFAWSMRNMTPTDQQETLNLLGNLTESIASDMTD